MALWKQPQKLIFDLGNLMNEKYTGSFNATLTATFIQDQDVRGPAASPADMIVPISAGQGASGLGSAFTYPDQEANRSVTIPRNVKRAVLSIAATGQSDEEFWWTNVPEEGIDTWDGIKLPGKSSFREVRLRIDGSIAGLSWPYPIVFTGGISPPLHRPVVGPQAFDLREQEIDITPWLGVLCDGKAHTFSLEVVGAHDAVVNRYWLLSGKIFLWLDEKGSITSGCKPQVVVSQPNFDPHQVAVHNKSLEYNQTVSRTLEIKSKIRRGGEELRTGWSQRFAMQNKGYLLDAGNIQQVEALYDGEDKATQGAATIYDSSYSYPMYLKYVQKAPDGNYSSTLDSNLTQTMILGVTGGTVFSNGLEPFLTRLDGRVGGSRIETTKEGRAFFWARNGGNMTGGFGSAHQTYTFDATRSSNGSMDTQRLYSRDVTVINETTTLDDQWIYGGGLPHKEQHWQKPQGNDILGFATRPIAGKRLGMSVDTKGSE
jgi:hypothetical protein